MTLTLQPSGLVQLVLWGHLNHWWLGPANCVKCVFILIFGHLVPCRLWENFRLPMLANLQTLNHLPGSAFFYMQISQSRTHSHPLCIWLWLLWQLETVSQPAPNIQISRSLAVYLLLQGLPMETTMKPFANIFSLSLPPACLWCCPVWRCLLFPRELWVESFFLHANHLHVSPNLIKRNSGQHFKHHPPTPRLRLGPSRCFLYW